MTLKIIQDRLENYKCASQQDEEMALREIAQEIALAALSRSNFLKTAIFQGGTCLRIFHSLERFSEDMDFILKAPESRFEWQAYFKSLETEFGVYGIDIAALDRSKTDETVKKAFIKSDSIGKVLTLRYPQRRGQPRSVKIKFEVDTNPPDGSTFEVRYHDFPFPFSAVIQDPSSLFAGKLHALLCRAYTKGRDWYDFAWHVGKKNPVNLIFFGNALHQIGPWCGKDISLTNEWLFNEMEIKIKTMDWSDAKKDVSRFLRPHELPILDLWNEEFFLDRLRKMRGYLVV